MNWNEIDDFIFHVEYPNGGGINVNELEWVHLRCTQPLKIDPLTKQTIKVIQGYDQYLEFAAVKLYGITIP